MSRQINEEEINSEVFFNRIDQDTVSNIARHATLGNADLLRKNLQEGKEIFVIDVQRTPPVEDNPPSLGFSKAQLHILVRNLNSINPQKFLINDHWISQSFQREF